MLLEANAAGCGFTAGGVAKGEDISNSFLFCLVLVWAGFSAFIQSICYFFIFHGTNIGRRCPGAAERTLRMKDGKLKRILALSGVLLLVGMYLLTLVFAFVDPTAGKNWLKASIVCTIFIPVFLYACIMLARYLKK